MENQLDTKLWQTELHPRFEGCNVGTWIGFKHVMYLAEEAVVQWFREQGLQPAALLEENALSLELTQCSLRLISGTRIDDVVTASLENITKPDDCEVRFKVTLMRDDDGNMTKLAVGKASVQFARALEFRENSEAVPHKIEPYVVDTLQREAPVSQVPMSVAQPVTQDAVIAKLKEQDPNAFVWPWRIPYFYCHNTYRLQMSGYARIMEEVVDQFLFDRNISIGSLLYDKQYNWIPVVSASKISLIEDARLEETVYTVFTVTDIMQDISYTAQMDCYVCRDGQLIRTATGAITHAYVAIADRRVGTELAVFDDRVKQALTGAQ